MAFAAILSEILSELDCKSAISNVVQRHFEWGFPNNTVEFPSNNVATHADENLVNPTNAFLQSEPVDALGNVFGSTIIPPGPNAFDFHINMHSLAPNDYHVQITQESFVINNDGGDNKTGFFNFVSRYITSSPNGPMVADKKLDLQVVQGGFSQNSQKEFPIVAINNNNNNNNNLALKQISDEEGIEI